jgi:hypothetical protein
MLKRFASNAGANVFSGAVAAAYQLTIAGMGIRAWHRAEFASWALALSVSAIAPIFAANLSSVVTRRVVEARHGNSGATESAIVLAGRRIGQRLAGIAFAILICAGAWIQTRSVSGAMSTGAFLVLLVLVLLTNSWLPLWQVRFGQHYADERNWLPALTLAAARIGGALGMFGVLAAGSRSLVAAAVGLCAGTWAGLGSAQLLLPRPSSIGIDGPRPASLEIQKQYRNNLRLLSGFAIGAVSMLVIQYSIPPLIALIAPDRFNAFYLASALNTVAIGVLAAAMSAMLAPFTRWHARGDTKSLQRVTLFSPALCAISCLAALCFCWYAMGPVLHAVTVRAANIVDIRIFLALLGYQTIIRNAAAGYAMYIASAGSSRQMGAPLVIEIVLAFSVAVPIGWLYGERALLYGLSFSGLVGSLYSSKVLASLHRPDRISLRAAFSSLLLAQAAVCGLWWSIVEFGL